VRTLHLALIAHRFQQNDGQGRVNYEVACRAASMGHKLTLLTAHCAPELAAMSNVSVVLIGNENLPSQLLRDFAFARASSEWIRAHRHEVDVVQANGYTTWEKCDVVTAHFVHAAWARSPWYPFRGSLQPRSLYQRLFTRVNAWFERRVYLKADKVIAVSDAVAAEVIRLSISQSKVQVIYNGVDIKEFQQGPAERERFRLPAGVPLALFVGDIRTTRKNLDTVLLALQQLSELHLAVAGDTAGSVFPEMASRLGLERRVHFLGKTSAIPALMRSVDLFVFPSRYEAHPLVVLEAMASGLPSVLASTVGSVSSFSECFEVLQNPDDAQGLAALLKGLLDNPERRTALGAAARARAVGLTWERTVAQYLAVYQAVEAQGAHAQATPIAVEVGTG
jgi:glycosyltransferase involved in cell wall biosynthesis